MSLISETFAFQESSIESIKDIDDMKRVFKDFVREFNRWYAKFYDNVENGGFQTKTWRAHEATAADVTSLIQIGDLLFQRRIGSAWVTSKAFRRVA